MEFKLEQWRPQYAKDAAKHADNIKIAGNLRDRFPHPYTLADAEAFIKICIERHGARELHYAIVIGGAAAGSISLRCQNDVYSKTADIGYWLGEEFWGRGVMPAAIRQICAEAFAKYDIVRIFAEVYESNPASCKVLEKAGFMREAVLKKNIYKSGKVLDSYIYALLK